MEGLNYEKTLEELRKIYPITSENDILMEEDDTAVDILPASVPSPIRDLASEKLPMVALGSMIWYLRQLNIDKDILTMKNFNIYDPMKRGMGLTLDGQTLSHLEVLLICHACHISINLCFRFCSTTKARKGAPF